MRRVKKSRAPRALYAWYSPGMARQAGVVVYRALDGVLVLVTLVDSSRSGRRAARWRDLVYVGRVRPGWCRRYRRVQDIVDRLEGGPR